jgi:hypothetical protein
VKDAIEGVLAARAGGAAVTLTIAGAPDPVERAYGRPASRWRARTRKRSGFPSALCRRANWMR